MNSLSDKAAFLIMANLFKYAVGFVMPMVLVRILSQSDYGTYQQLALIATTTIAFMTIGLPYSVFYFFDASKKTRMAALIMQTTLLLIFFGVVSGVALAFFASLVAEKFNNPQLGKLLPIYAAAIGLMIASDHYLNVMISQGRYGLAVLFELIETIVRVLVLLVPILLGFGLMGLTLGLVFYSAMRFGARSLYAFYKSGFGYAGWSRECFVRDQFAYSVPLALGTLAGIISSTFNRGIVATAFSPAEYAIYAVGALEIPLDVIFQASVATVLRASMPALVREGNLVEAVRLVRESVRKLSIIMLPSFVFLLGNSHQFITLLFTERYAESVAVFQIYLWVMPLNMFILSPIAHVFGKTKMNLYINIFSGLLLIALSFFLLKVLGFYGPAIAMVLVQWITSLVWLIVVLRLLQTSVVRLLPLSDTLRVVLASLLGLACSRISVYVGLTGWLGFICAGIIFSVVFMATAALLKVFTPEDYRHAHRWLAKIFPQSTK